MGRDKIYVGDKSAWPSEPYRPSGHMVTECVGRDAEMRLVTAAWMAGRRSPPLSPLLVGEPGVGKNRLVYELAHRTNRELYIFQGHEDVTAEDLACAVRFSDSAETRMDYVTSPLVTAMLRGGICFIDEIGKIRPRALALLVSVLDERRYIDSSLLAERIIAHPGFRFIAATNTGEVNALPEFIRSRMRPVVRVGYPTRREIDQILAHQFPGPQQNIGALLDAFWIRWEKHASDARPPTPRDAIHLLGLATSMSDFDRFDRAVPFDCANESAPFSLEATDAVPDLQPEHLERAFDQLFSKNGTEPQC